MFGSIGAQKERIAISGTPKITGYEYESIYYCIVFVGIFTGWCSRY
jgi:hypothetical protein